MKRSTGAVIVVVAAALPRLLVLMRERETILDEFVDKSDRFATTLVDHGTFGFLAGVPSAYTQPLYGWFLAGLYYPFGRSWLAVGIAQVVVAVATALVVFEIGSRLQIDRRRPRRRAHRDAAPVRRLARRAPEPGGARRARARRSRTLRARGVRAALAPARRRRRAPSRASRSSATRGSSSSRSRSPSTSPGGSSRPRER